MADPREAANYDGIGYKALTYVHDDTIVYDVTKVGGSAQVGLAVTLEANAQVSLVGNGEQVEGLLIKVEPGGFCVVQVGGMAIFKGGNGASLTAGLKIVGALGPSSAEGYIKNASTEHTVSRGTIITAADPTAVRVRLDAI